MVKILFVFLAIFQMLSVIPIKSAEEDKTPLPRTQTTHKTLDSLLLLRNADNNNLISNVASFLPMNDKFKMRRTAKRYRDSVDLVLFDPRHNPNIQVFPFSSEISPGTVGNNIMKLLSSAQRRIIIASDKCTNQEFFDDLFVLLARANRILEVKIVTSEDISTQEALEKYTKVMTHQAVPANTNRSGKMHNKFIIVDDIMVITGSPNLTLAAYNYNVESFVAIKHCFVARLYLNYYNYIVSGKDKYDHTQPEYQTIEKMLSFFNNAPGNPIQVCLSPITNVKAFVIQALSTPQDVVNINMFLVSRAKTPGNDIVDSLLGVVRSGAKVSIKVDGNQYDTTYYMQPALAPLVTAGAEAFKVVKNPEEIIIRTKKITTKPQFHDKLVLIQLRDGSKRILIGSAGFTDNVQDNLNLENMVLLEIGPTAPSPNVYDILLGHFNAINGSRGNLVVTKL